MSGCSTQRAPDFMPRPLGSQSHQNRIGRSRTWEVNSVDQIRSCGPRDLHLVELVFPVIGFASGPLILPRVLRFRRSRFTRPAGGQDLFIRHLGAQRGRTTRFLPWVPARSSQSGRCHYRRLSGSRLARSKRRSFLGKPGYLTVQSRLPFALGSGCWSIVTSQLALAPRIYVAATAGLTRSKANPLYCEFPPQLDAPSDRSNARVDRTQITKPADQRMSGGRSPVWRRNRLRRCRSKFNSRALDLSNEQAHVHRGPVDSLSTAGLPVLGEVAYRRVNKKCNKN